MLDLRRLRCQVTRIRRKVTVILLGSFLPFADDVPYYSGISTFVLHFCFANGKVCTSTYFHEGSLSYMGIFLVYNLDFFPLVLTSLLAVALQIYQYVFGNLVKYTFEDSSTQFLLSIIINLLFHHKCEHFLYLIYSFHQLIGVFSST